MLTLINRSCTHSSNHSICNLKSKCAIIIMLIIINGNINIFRCKRMTYLPFFRIAKKVLSIQA